MISVPLWVSLYSVCIGLIVLGNTIIIVGIARSKAISRNPPTIFILSLVVARMCVGIFVVPAYITGIFSEEYLGSTLCKLCHFINLTSLNASIVSSVLVAICKYLEVVWWHGVAKVTVTKATVVTLLSWLASAAYGVRAAILNDLVFLPVLGLWSCVISPGYVTIAMYMQFVDLVLVFVAPSCVIMFCTLATIRRLGDRIHGSDSAPRSQVMGKSETPSKGSTELSPIEAVTPRRSCAEEDKNPREAAISGSKPVCAPMSEKSTMCMISMIAVLFVVMTMLPYPFNLKLALDPDFLTVPYIIPLKLSLYLVSFCNSWINAIIILYFRSDIRRGVCSGCWCL